MNGSNGDQQLLAQGEVVSQLHNILKPFLLRRLKTEVERSLPPKKEYLLYAPLTQQQNDMYKAIVNRDIRDYLVNKKLGENGMNGQAQEAESVDSSDSPGSEETQTRTSRRLSKRPRLDYSVDTNDRIYNDAIERGDLKTVNMSASEEDKTAEQMGQEWALKQATRTVNNMKLQNMIMQLRKVSSHPYLFDWPRDSLTNDLIVDDNLVNASGKMLLLQRLLDGLFDRGHKVLIFSQFTTMLDVIEDWANLFKKWRTFRIDGTTKQPERLEQMDEFNSGGDDPDACKLFLLSTRAGGLGINLVAADTVIFFDQDWNPQADLQAADRAHRIGQTKPVLVFRLVTAHTIETKILKSAGNKRKLEALVISKGKFGAVDANGQVLLGRESKNKKSVEDIAKNLLDLDSEEINIASKDDQVIRSVHLGS